MEGKEEVEVAEITNMYSIWAIPPENVTERLKKVTEDLRFEFGGPEFRPHITVVGATRLTEPDALHKFKSACQGLKPYTATATCISRGTSTQCLHLRFRPSYEMLEASSKSSRIFGYIPSYPYMPHASLFYGDLTEEEKQKAKAKAEAFDTTLSSLCFTISRLALYRTERKVESWEKIAEYDLV